MSQIVIASLSVDYPSYIVVYSISLYSGPTSTTLSYPSYDTTSYCILYYYVSLKESKIQTDSKHAV